MCTRVAVLGGGHGVAAALRALRGHDLALTVVVTVADDGGSSGELRRRWGGPAVGDMRRSLIALTGEEEGPGRALAAPVTMAQFGRHPLGNLVLFSLAKAFGELEAASEWIGGQLGLSACVLPATTRPVTLAAAAGGEVIRGESSVGTAPADIERLRFDPERPEVPPAVLDAIGHADCVLLAPGSLFTSVLAVCALPDIAAALAQTPARVVWICNLAPEIPETAGMSAADHLGSLRRHCVRVDAVVYDPASQLRFSPAALAAADLPGFAYPLMSEQPHRHDPVLLSAALHDLISARAAAPPDISARTGAVWCGS
ncbi:MAG TPA: uridine diphosphate-N-acetylglucosamine-binding protein YvcK [Solirubrobacteraceae bacterium]|nr:uridine diphosphate-N-acetylglucosamine-binding protein YvcK [Solirubrobacteraceae bacterium]